MSGNIKPVPPCTGLITRFVQQNVLLLRTTAIHGGYVGNNPVNFIDPWGLSASDGRGNNGNANLLLSGLTKTLSGSVKTVTGLAGAAAGMLASAVLVADNGTVVLTVDDAALLVTVPFTAASGKYAFDGAREAVDGVTDLAAGIVGTAKSVRNSISKSRTDTIAQSKTNRDNYIVTIQIQGPSITQNRRKGASHGSHIKNLASHRPITYAEAQAGLDILKGRSIISLLLMK